MEILQLQYFCFAAESGSFSATADKFKVPSSSVSQSIKRLEKELGISLFDRRANRIELNESGRIFYDKVKSGLDMISDAKTKVLSEDVEGKIKLLVISNRGIVNRAILNFCRKYAKVSFKVDSTKKDVYDKYDVIITDDFGFNESYVRKSFVNEKIKLALNKNHPLANKENISPLDIQNENIITDAEGTGKSILAKRVCAQSGFAPKILIHTDDVHSLAEYVEKGLGVALVPEIEFKDIFSENVIIKDITDIVRGTVLCYNRKRYMTKAVRLFIDELYEEVKKECIG